MRALHTLLRRLVALADACLPATCIVCAGDEPAGICAACENDLPGSHARRCIRCGLLVDAPGERGANAERSASNRHEASLDCSACVARLSVVTSWSEPSFLPRPRGVRTAS